MKTIISLILLTSFNYVSYSQNCTQEWPLPYFQNFESIAPPALPPCSISQSISPAVSTGNSTNWRTYFSGGTMGNVLSFQINNPIYRYNLWYFLPKMNFSSSKAYRIKFTYSSTTSNPSEEPTLEVAYGSCAAASCMNQFLWIQNLLNTNFQTATLTFTPNISGEYFIGFHHADYNVDPGGSQPFLDSIYVEDMSTLPVMLSPIAATVKNNIVTISFQTLTESNNSGFDVEQSADGTVFTKIGYAASKATSGNSTLPISYSFATLFAAPAFYRLRQVDKDGRFAYSNTVHVKEGKVHQLVAQLLQNPVGQLAKASVYMPSAGVSNIRVIDATGRNLLQQSIMLAQGYNAVSIGLPNITKGNYYISFSKGNNKPVIIPFIKE